MWLSSSLLPGSLDGLASSGVDFYPSRSDAEDVQSPVGLAERLLAQPTEKSSREGCAAALLLAHVAWNRAVDPLGGDQVGYYRKGLRRFRQRTRIASGN